MGGGMRIVVVGATGNVGTSVVECLSRDERVREIIGVARRQPSWDAPKTRFVQADVGSDDLAPHMEGADAVLHLAWLFQPTHSPLVTWRVNALGSIRVFDAAAAAGVRTVLYASSVGAYSPGYGRTVDESWPTHSVPTAAYGREKAYVERVLDAFEVRHPEIRVVRMRPHFIFKHESASQQRRLFAGPLLPKFLVRPGMLPALPVPAGLRFQALHTSDAAEAYRLALFSDARGAFNLAADPVIDGAALGELLGTRVVAVPRMLLRGALATAWHLHLVPAEPALLDLTMHLPLLDTMRARTELGWVPRYTGIQAMQEMLRGMADGAGADTPPLTADSLGERVQEVASAVGERP
ncbi:MAG TPA: NAD-dependent epimerase/dehydratase family protein [Actinomycetota bacterium]|nr:NAD-dependent epimerase/dehydratase family protein [Actinomycetota bacterium]